MIETLFAPHPEFLIPIIALLGTTIVFTVWIVAHYWHGMKRQELESSLKRDMLSRGFTAEEIQRVIASSSASERVDA